MIQVGKWLELIDEKDVAEAYQSAPNWHSVLSSLQCRAVKKYREELAATPAAITREQLSHCFNQATQAGRFSREYCIDRILELLS